MVDLSSITLKQIAAFIVAAGVLVTAMNAAFAWYFHANHAHELTEQHEVVIDEHLTIWGEAREKRVADIAEAEEVQRLYKSGKLQRVED